MRNGSGVAATLWIEGELVTFKLALAFDKRWHSKYHKFIFVSDNGKVIDSSFYSGGDTGFGRDTYEIKDLDPAEFEVISTDLDYIINFQKEEEEREKKEKEEFNQRQEERVKKLNELPEKTPIFQHIYMKRDTAEYSPRYSSKISFHYSLETDDRNYIDINQFFNKTGGALLKKFQKEMEYLLNIKPSTKERDLMILQAIKYGFDGYKKMVDDILRS